MTMYPIAFFFFFLTKMKQNRFHTNVISWELWWNPFKIPTTNTSSAAYLPQYSTRLQWSHFYIILRWKCHIWGVRFYQFIHFINCLLWKILSHTLKGYQRLRFFVFKKLYYIQYKWLIQSLKHLLFELSNNSNNQSISKINLPAPVF